MEKHYCDRCAKEVSNAYILLRVYYKDEDDIDLCKSCYKKFKKFMEAKNV